MSGILISKTGTATIGSLPPMEVIISHLDDSIEIFQSTHDNVNLNANLQIGDADVDGSNPVPVSFSGNVTIVQATHDNLNLNANIQVNNTDVSSSNPVPTTQAGLARANAPVRNDHSSTNITTGAYVTLVASLASDVSALHIFDSSGKAMYLAVGPAASEVDQIYIVPGGTDLVPLAIPAGSRVSIKAVSSTINKGELLISFLG